MAKNKVNESEQNEGAGKSGKLNVCIAEIIQPDRKHLKTVGHQEYKTSQFEKGYSTIKYIPNTPEDVRKRESYKNQRGNATGESMR